MQPEKAGGNLTNLWFPEYNLQKRIGRFQRAWHEFLFWHAEQIYEQMDTLLLLYSGRPLEVSEIAGKANARLEAWMPGTEGNRAVRDILTGHRSPSGRLTMSFPYSTGQCPVYYNRYSTGRPAKAPYHSDRFTSRYIDGPGVPFYPFGHGLTYTEFEYGSVELSSGMVHRREKIYARCTVRNTGERESYI